MYYTLPVRRFDINADVRYCLLLRAQLTERARIAMATWAKVLGEDAAAKR